LLTLQALALLREVLAPVGQLGQADRAGLVGVQQALVGSRDPVQPGTQLLVGSAIPGGAGLGRSGEVVELRQQSVRVGEQPGDVAPHDRLDLLGPDVAARAGGSPRAQDAVLAAALVVLPLRLRSYAGNWVTV